MLMEFQLSAAKLRAILLSRIRRQEICVTEEFTLGADTLVLDHIELPDSGAFSREDHDVVIHVPGGNDQTISGTKVRFSQPVILQVVKTSTLEAHGEAKSPPDMSPQITLFFDLTMTVDSGVPRFRVKLAGVDAELLAALDPGAAALIESKVAFDVVTDMDLSSVADLLETTVTATNAGIVISEDLSRVSMRIEVNGTDNQVSAWTSFFTGAVTDHLGGKDWSIVLDSGLIVPVVVSRIGDGMAGSSGFSLQSGPSGSWSWVGGPAVEVSFSGEVIDACTCFFWEIDVDVDVSVNVGLSVPSANTLRMDANMSWDLNDGEVFCCALTAGVFWLAVGAIMLANDKIGWDAFLGGLALGPISTFIGTIVMASNATPDIDAGASCSKISDTHIRCDQPVKISAGLGSLTLDAIAGLPEGPLLSGTMFAGVAFGTPEIATDAGGFTWHLEGSCSGGYHITNNAGILITSVGAAGIGVCEIKILDDALGVYSAALDKNPQDPNWVIGAVVIEANLTPAFLANPYPCKVMLKTNGGARIITIPPPQQITPEQERALQIASVNAKVGCMKLADPFWAATGRMNPKWIPDPPPDRVFEHLWQVLVIGMQPSEKLVASDHAGQIIAIATASARGVAQISALTAPIAGGAGELGLARIAGVAAPRFMSAPIARPLGAIGVVTAAATAEATTSAAERTVSEEQRKLMIKQIVLVRDATFNLSGHAIAIGAGHLGNAPVVYTVDGDGLRIYDAGSLAAPFLVQSLRARGLRGATLWRDRVVVWGEHGLCVLAAGESRVGLAATRIDSAVRDVIRLGGHLAVLTDDGVTMLAADLSRATVIPVRGATYLASAGRLLLVGTAAGLDAYDLGHAVAPRRAASHPLAGITAMRAPATADAKDVLFAHRLGGGGTMLHVGPGGLTELVHYERDPWYVGAARAGRTIGRLVDHGARLAIYHIARARDL